MTWQSNRRGARALLSLLAALQLASCNDEPPVPAELALCVHECPEGGLVTGNAAISGVPLADTFFATVLDQHSAAEHTSAALEAELSALRSDFGVTADEALGAEILRQGAALLASGPLAVASQTRCWVDVQQLLALQGECDPELAAEGVVECRGACQVEPGTDCGRLATLECSNNAAAIECADRCDGHCTDAPDAAGGCDGACRGACDGHCDRFERVDGELRCAGRCAGRCSGQCEEAVAQATCRGTCTGICTLENPEDGCDAPIRAVCQPDPGRTFACPGQCEGIFDAPSGEAICRTHAEARARMSARCDVPQVHIHYALEDSNTSNDQQAYLGALEGLRTRLPGLLTAVAHAELLQNVGQGLTAAASAEVKDALSDRLDEGEESMDIQTRTGLGCALVEVDQTDQALEPSRRRLATALTDAAELLGALDLD